MSLLVLIITLCCCSIPLIDAQQPYVAKTTTNCSDESSSAPGYSCNGLNTTCQAYLTFRATPQYDTVSSISALLGSDPSELSSINSVTENATLDSDKLVIVPVKCSCSGGGDQEDQYYQANATYVVRAGDTPFGIANNTFQGLSTCQAVQAQNGNLSATNIYAGNKLVVPLRCACPTKNQTGAGYNYLLSYLVATGDSVSGISSRFGGDTETTLAANELNGVSSTIYPFTTLLVPVKSPPSSSQTVASPPPPPHSSFTPASPNSGKSSSKSWIYVVVGVIGGVGLIGAIVFFVFFRRRSKKKKDPEAEPVVMASKDFEAEEKPLGKKMDEELPEFLESLSSIAQSIKVYSFEELRVATDEFSPSCWIKGSVYRGLINGDHAAIKKIDGDVSKEIGLLNKISHFNVIRLSGVCFDEGRCYLVYEYAANGPLKDWIYQDSPDGKLLSWTQRVRIGLDVATGLNYLHSFATPPCVHKNIKSSNILLDSDFRGKIANLALARLADGEFALTRHIVGTKGYMAPEYLENGLVSTKLDVYAFGILLLETITGKEVASLYREDTKNLSDMIHNLLSEDGMEGLRQFIDPSLEGNYPLELAVLLLRLIDGCLHKNQADRLDMDEVAQSLTRIFTISLAWESTNTISAYRN